MKNAQGRAVQPFARLVLVASTIVFISSHSSAAKTYSFTNVIDSTGSLNAIKGASINNDGTVLVRAALDAGGEGIFTVSGNTLRTIADTNGEFAYVSGLRISNSGSIAFLAGYDVGFPLGGQTIFVDDGETHTPIVDTSGQFYSFGWPTVNSNGEVVFQGRLDSNTWGIFLVSDGTVETIAHESGPFDHISMSYFGNLPAIDDIGTVAFSGWLDTGERGIYTSSGGTISTVVDDEGPWTAFSWDPDLNENGSVIFSATPETGPNGIFLQSSSTTMAVAEVDETVLSMDKPVVNSSGDVAFEACFLDNDGCAETGILTGGDPVADKVIRQGDLLFGAATTKINFYKGLNDSGQIAFAYELDNGVTGVAIATPMIDGDYNGDGTVNAADYVVWRKNDGTQAGLDTWRAQFGETAGSGSGARANGTVPEPATLMMLIVAAAGWFVQRDRASEKVP